HERARETTEHPGGAPASSVAPGRRTRRGARTPARTAAVVARRAGNATKEGAAARTEDLLDRPRRALRRRDARLLLPAKAEVELGRAPVETCSSRESPFPFP